VLLKYETSGTKVLDPEKGSCSKVTSSTRRRCQGPRRRRTLTEELKRLHVPLPDQATRLAAALGYNSCPTEAVGLHRFRTRQVHWTELRSKMFDANQMLKENNPKLSSEFVADVYAHARGRTR
jgi:hypothetical protein